ncbi:MAG TPA: tripartite tricarboxylate transporter substrate-binding protein, partial [Burkholderiales bacterium]|nr:tripartite tricarboxylate transporter substrate-binding protein [Burkholderiales bacterium]
RQHEQKGFQDTPAFRAHRRILAIESGAVVTAPNYNSRRARALTAGRGTVGHLASELLNSTAGIKLVAVHYKGSGPSMIDLVAGHVQLQFPSMPAAVPHVRTGKLRMIAQTGEKRSGAAPDVPTMREQGLKDFVVSSGFALFAPAGTPRAIIERVHAALVKALNDPGVRKSLADQGAEVVASTPEEHDRFNRAEIAKWIKVARAAGIEPE